MSGAKTLAKRTFVLFFISSLLVMLAATVATTAASFSSYERDAEERLLSQAAVLSEAIKSDADVDDMRATLEQSFLGNIRCTLVAADGTVLYDSQVAADELENHATRDEIKTARDTGQNISLRKSATLGTDTLYAAVLVKEGVVLRLAETRISLASFLGGMSLQLFVSLLAIFALSLVAARLLTRMVVKPLRDIDLSAPLNNSVYQEIQPLLARVDVQRRELQAQNEELEHAVNLRRDFTGNVSHELKSPLQVISGYAELMESGLVAQEDIPRFAGLIRQESTTMRELVDDILTLSRLDERAGSKMEAVNLAQACRHAWARLEPKAAERGVTLTSQLDEKCGVLGDVRLMEQVVYNLLDNAITYSPQGSEVSVAVLRVEGMVQLRVTDEGPGIPAEYRERIFERFFRVDGSRARETGGTGLGLAIVKHVAETFGGTVHVEAPRSSGATFVVNLLPA